MITCPTCSKEYDASLAACPDCVSQPARFGAEHDLRLVSVYTAQDEMTAHLIHGALVNNGVTAYIHSEQAAMFGTILQSDHGCWGEVMVPEAQVETAREIVEAFTTEDPDAEARAEQEAMGVVEPTEPAEATESTGTAASNPVPSPPGI